MSTIFRDDAKIRALDSRKVVDTSTGEVVMELGDRNSSPSRADALRAFDSTIFGGFRPRADDLPADYHGGPDPYWCPHTGDMWTCKRCNNGVKRVDGKEVRKATEAQRRAALSREDITWHYASAVIWFGRDAEGHDWQMDAKTGRIERAYSLNQRRDALVLVDEYGLSAASRKTGIPRTTLKNWKTRQ